MKGSSDLEVLALELKFEAAMPAIMFSQYLPSPLWFVLLLVGVTVLLAHITHERIREKAGFSAQLKTALFWGALHAPLCLVGVIGSVWFQKGGVDMNRFGTMVALAGSYGALFCVNRLISLRLLHLLP